MAASTYLFATVFVIGSHICAFFFRWFQIGNKRNKSVQVTIDSHARTLVLSMNVCIRTIRHLSYEISENNSRMQMHNEHRESIR